MKKQTGLLAIVMLGACTNTPVITSFGAYFPSWIACSIIGIVGTVIVRLIFIKTGIDDTLRFRVIVYFLTAIACGLAASLFIFGR